MGSNTRALIVDDSLLMRHIVKKNLKSLGFSNILEAENGGQALEILREDRVGLILSDWTMPGMTGLDLLKKIRDDDDLKDTPFIMVTAEGLKGNIQDAVTAGVSNYITKPFTPETLGEIIKTVLKE